MPPLSFFFLRLCVIIFRVFLYQCDCSFESKVFVLEVEVKGEIACQFSFLIKFGFWQEVVQRKRTCVGNHCLSTMCALWERTGKCPWSQQLCLRKPSSWSPRWLLECPEHSRTLLRFSYFCLIWHNCLTFLRSHVQHMQRKTNEFFLFFLLSSSLPEYLLSPFCVPGKRYRAGNFSTQTIQALLF